MKRLLLLLLLCFPIISLAQNSAEKEPHKYGGWYCPDNLNGFPAVDINNWENVPIVNGRMATKDRNSKWNFLNLC